MKIFRRISCCLLATVLLVSACAASDLPGRIAGVVRDAAGQPVEGANVTLTAEQKSEQVSKEQQTSTDSEGRYAFSGIPPGQYHLEATRSGLRASSLAPVTIAATSVSVTVNITLPPPNADAATHPSQPAAPLHFEAAGVRGLIDPGGYSAAANAAAASGLIAGVADIKRSGNGAESSSSGDWPCNLEPALKKAVDAAPGNADANRRLGQFYVAHEEAAKALPYFEQASRSKPGDDSAIEDLAAAWMANGRFDLARESLTPLAARSSDPAVHSLLARADEGSGRFPQASEEYAVAAKADPSQENLFGIGYELILAGSPKDADIAFQAATTRYPRSIILLLGAGTAKFLEGHSTEALHSFLQANDVDPSDPRPYPFLSSLSEVSGTDNEHLRSSFKRFVDLAPADPQASYFYALDLLRERGTDAAIDSKRIESLFKRAIQLDPDFAEAHFRLGTLYAQTADEQNAVREYESAVQLDPDLAEAHYRLAGAYSRTGHGELATHEMQRFADLRATAKPDSDDARIRIERFVSVLDRPGKKTKPETSCSAAKH